MTRTAARELAIRIGFAQASNPGDAAMAADDFFQSDYYATLSGEDKLFTDRPDERQLDYIRRSVAGVCERREQLDGYISAYSRGWKLSRVSRTAAAIMRQAMYEILYMPDVPFRAAINEAVELAKAYEEPETVAYINGVLGGFYRGECDAEADIPVFTVEELLAEDEAGMEPVTEQAPAEPEA